MIAESSATRPDPTHFEIVWLGEDDRLSVRRGGVDGFWRVAWVPFVFIPARNEERLLGRGIFSMIDAGVPPGHIAAIDDDSSDRTKEVMFLA